MSEKTTEKHILNIEKVSIELLNPAPYNPRVDLKPSDPEYQHIKNSLDDFGYLDPIVWNKRTGNIVSGHQRYKILKAEGATELEVMVVDFDPDKEKACNLAMNQAVGLWDDDKLAELLEEMQGTEWDMSDFGFEGFDEELGADEENPYTMNVDAPIYQPTGECPALSELVDTAKADELQARINEADIPSEVKQFLYFASCRHYVFDYKKIAEYYCHADKAVQELMEQSALVIIDFQSAIKNGFAKLSKDIADMRDDNA